MQALSAYKVLGPISKAWKSIFHPQSFSYELIAMEQKEPHTSLNVLPERTPRRSSVAETISKGFEAANVLRSPTQTLNQGQNPHGDSTTFASKGFDVYYRPSDGWEGLHRYDPDFTWEPSEERKLVRKVGQVSADVVSQLTSYSSTGRSVHLHV